MSFISLITILCVGSDRPVVRSTHPALIITIPSVVVQHELHDTRRYSYRAFASTRLHRQCYHDHSNAKRCAHSLYRGLWIRLLFCSLLEDDDASSMRKHKPSNEATPRLFPLSSRPPSIFSHKSMIVRPRAPRDLGAHGGLLASF
ncbi:uncharacterized protein SCHCODRAFT_02718846 [Schizophyllum commune H4-8]|uniref:uncharacterized protein n=1 Tax=Schizophyllum commune (strain H4-8 / FGSC 9210) TaxID=578458 RepID=UPI0021607519|nr:uncharacterized protein SCHCODRAFT_02718846 [Schizophyllum commune H4-8]KAI5885295.1 hypothetical protein SCHCODRAFT_02718846 [Schizophyllum commune H4-8]